MTHHQSEVAPGVIGVKTFNYMRTPGDGETYPDQTHLLSYKVFTTMQRRLRSSIFRKTKAGTRDDLLSELTFVRSQ